MLHDLQKRASIWLRTNSRIMRVTIIGLLLILVTPSTTARSDTDTQHCAVGNLNNVLYNPTTQEILVNRGAGADVEIWTPAGDKIEQRWNLKSEQDNIKETTSDINQVAFSPDGNLLLTASNDGTSNLWNAQTGTLVRTLGNHQPNNGSAVGFLSNTTVVIALADTRAKQTHVQRWDIRTGVLLSSIKILGFMDGLLQSGQTINTHTFTGSHDGIPAEYYTRVWSTVTGELRFGIPRLPALLFSPSGKNFVTLNGGSSFELWDSQTISPLRILATALSGIVLTAAYSPDGKLLLFGEVDGISDLWDVGTDTRLYRLKTDSTDGIGILDFSPDGQTALLGTQDGLLTLWDVHSGTLLQSLCP